MAVCKEPCTLLTLALQWRAMPEEEWSEADFSTCELQESPLLLKSKAVEAAICNSIVLIGVAIWEKRLILRAHLRHMSGLGCPSLLPLHRSVARHQDRQ
jgi:hypothetical protein